MKIRKHADSTEPPQGYAITTALEKVPALRPIQFVFHQTCSSPKAQTLACFVIMILRLESSKTFGATYVFGLVSLAVLSVNLPKLALSASVALACSKETRGSALKTLTLNTNALEVQKYVNLVQRIVKAALHLQPSARYVMTDSTLLILDAGFAGLFVRPATITVNALSAAMAGIFIKSAFSASLVINRDNSE